MSDHHHSDDHGHRPHHRRPEPKKGTPWWVWLLVILAVLAGIWFFFLRTPPAEAFTIGAGEGLVHHVSYQEAIDRAEACGIPLAMKVQGAPSVPIGYDTARGLETETDQIKVTAQLQVGDVFGPKVDDCPARTLYR